MIKSSLLTNRRSTWALAAIAVGSLTLSSCTDAVDPSEPDETAPADPTSELAPEARAEDLQFALAAPSAVASAKDGVQVIVTVTNLADHQVRVLKRNTPLDGIKEDLFLVARDGVAVEYLGRHYKWAAPQPEDFVALDAGASLAATVDLATAYDFAETGSYAVDYGGADARASQLTSAAITVRVEGRPFVIPSSGEPELSASLTSTGCSSTRITQLTTAYASARTMASAALSYLTSTTPSGTARYVTWFGSFTSSRWSTAKTHYTAISQKLVNEVANCTCTDSAYAYVYPTQPYTIYLCNAFWSAPNTGTDSRAGTLIHEMSHFNVVASTRDNAYGQTACKSLARSNPTKALANADSHEYFAENTPAQQ